MPLNLTQLATLNEFVRRGSLTAAAEALGYTAGAASQQISALERSVGKPLLRKAGRHLVLTDAGRVLAEHAEGLLLAESRAVRAVTDGAGEVAGTLVVGTWGSTTAALLAPVLGEAAARYPRLGVRSREIDVDEAARAVRLGDVDVAFGLDYPDAPMPRDPRIRLLRLRRESFALAMSPRDSLAARSEASLYELDSADWVMPTAHSAYGMALRTVCRRHGFEPTVVHEVTDTAATLVLAAEGVGIAPVTDLMLRLNPTVGIRRVPLRESVTRDIVLVLPDGVHDATLLALVGVVRGVVSRSRGGAADRPRPGPATTSRCP
ncbi:LysR family transcriptional regulator [Nocardioides humi]|uniref:LysR family transcriptional regulator n=1 Tax=Nocardioides humi TaxID=449461 RepID=A0ABN2BQU7_9ACTN|nr:LysR family transcriptional regulator [Nocardioides humi]